MMPSGTIHPIIFACDTASALAAAYPIAFRDGRIPPTVKEGQNLAPAPQHSVTIWSLGAARNCQPDRLRGFSD
jgi:hypothetical protein